MDAVLFRFAGSIDTVGASDIKKTVLLSSSQYSRFHQAPTRVGLNILKNPPKMVYVSSVNPCEIKGPHIHSKRTSYFTCIHGKVVFVIKKPDGTYDEIPEKF